MSTARLDLLPTEIALDVFAELGGTGNVIRFAGTSRRLRNIFIQDTERILSEVLICGEQAVETAKTQAGILGRPIDLDKPDSAAFSSGWAVGLITPHRDAWLPILLRNAELATLWVRSFGPWLDERRTTGAWNDKTQFTSLSEAYYTFRQLALAYSDHRELDTLLARLEGGSAGQLATYARQKHWLFDASKLKELEHHEMLKDPDAYFPEDETDDMAMTSKEYHVLRDDWDFAWDVFYQYECQDHRDQKPLEHKLDSLFRGNRKDLGPDPPARWTGLQPELARRLNGIAYDRWLQLRVPILEDCPLTALSFSRNEI